MKLTMQPNALRAPSSSLQRPSSARHSGRRCFTAIRATVEAPERVYSSEEKEKPEWTGDSILSRVVNAAIGFPPLFAVMKIGARSAIKGTAEKRSVPWQNNVTTLENTQEVYKIKEELENKSLTYPDYYTMEFHGYDEGNLNWQAAFECEPASDAMCLRVYKTETDLSVMDAARRVRMGILDAVGNFITQHNLRTPSTILDIGCSVGVSTRWLAHDYPEAEVTGLDLSPYMLAVAELRERQRDAGLIGDGLITPGSSGGSSTPSSRRRITYLHANMESSGLPDASFDMISVQFVAHECPTRVLENIVKEARRLVKPGGVVLIADNNPRSKVIQGLPPVLFTLMKSTEPHSDEYYAFDLEEEMTKQGLKGVVTVESDPRHRAVLGYL